MIVFVWSDGAFLLVGKAFGAESLGGAADPRSAGGFLESGQRLFGLVRTVLAGFAGGSSR